MAIPVERRLLFISCPQNSLFQDFTYCNIPFPLGPIKPDSGRGRESTVEFCTLQCSLKLCNLPLVQPLLLFPTRSFSSKDSVERVARALRGFDGTWLSLTDPTFPFPYREKGTDMFRASVVIPSKDKAAFLLSYEELLQRRLGKYEHVISVRPQQLVGRLMVEVNILERSGIESLEVLPLQHSRQKGSGRGEGECNAQVSCADSERGLGFRGICKTEGTPSTKALRVRENLEDSTAAKAMPCAPFKS